MMKKKRWWKTTLYWLVIILGLALSLVLIFNQQVKDYLVNTYQPQVTKSLVAKNEKKKVSYDFSSVKDLNLQTVAAARAKKESINVIGVISIPAINLRIPIAKGVSNTTLALAAGTMRADQEMGKGNYPLAAHNMANGSKILFSPLYYHGKVGQLVYITDMKKVYEYKLYERKFIDATRVDVIDNTKENILTLVTCDATGARRLLMRGKLVKVVAYDKAPAKIQKNLSGKYTNGQ
ncbi:class A sortase [Limosilactobacillus fermentum]|uniref:class A sortase n=1 Tax=Limosilactobacillus fermentum TaxID=1613 RepID=UPI00019C5B4D|nr:class A sortase [Limosilactobacillus fermentum]OFT09740.1 class A sortase [Lactobacillus sp. HMSC24D01]EEI22638.1 sortase family protein [Limosilactobacillus fermentum ATCC 14931]MCH5402474.1 class A sortase [Limosilactobacillus fermentum]MCT3455523.1 class A sortase [Limosilactobacillus fermentum]MCT3461680.1 class A sortase [Limosilactobacillus fermentum]